MSARLYRRAIELVRGQYAEEPRRKEDASSGATPSSVLTNGRAIFSYASFQQFGGMDARLVEASGFLV